MPNHHYSLCFALVAIASMGCNKTVDAPKESPAAPATVAASVTAPVAKPAAEIDAAKVVAVNAEAPAFELTDLEGKSVKLADFKGKTVVLEWFNPECPFVKRSHTKGSLATSAKTWTGKGVVWLAINSGAEGKQGFGVEKNKAGAAELGVTYPVLLDPTGTVGRTYGATNTPHIVVVSPEGKVVYRGAIDNSPDGEGESPEGGKLVDYADQALTELAAGKPVSLPETKAYGCGVKYGS